VHLTVNGRPLLLNPPHTIRHVIEHLELDPALTVVEHNGVALLRTEWDAMTPADGDRIELLRIAAGG